MKKRRLVTMLLMICMLVFLFGMNVMAYTNVIGKAGSKGANIRASASTKSEIIGSVAGNTEVTICGEVQGSDGYTWYLVFLNGSKIGYMRSDAVTKTDKAAGGTTEGEGGGSTIPSTPSQGSDCTLSIVRVGSGELVPEFSPDIYEYTLEVSATVNKVSVIAKTTDAKATIPADVHFTDLQMGKNDKYIRVTGADGSTQDYHFLVIRGEVVDEPVTDPVPDQIPEDQPATDTPADTQPQTTPQKTDTTVKSTGISKWIVFFLIIVIIILILVIVYMAIQMRDMKETIDALERERRRRKKKEQEAHKISAVGGSETDGSANKSSVMKKSILPQSPYPTEMKREPISVSQDYVKPISYDVKNEVEEEVMGIEKPEENNYGIEPESVPEKPVMRESYTAKESVSREETAGKDENWHAVNFLAPEDDMEFEFINLDEDENGSNR